jgi:hypothetical protein
MGLANANFGSTTEIDAFYEAQLARVGLDKPSLEQQSAMELEDSLDRLDVMLANPASLGLFRMQFQASGTAIISKSSSDAHLEYGPVALLLERKKIVTDRLRTLRMEQPVHDLISMVNSIDDAKLRKLLLAELEALRLQSPVEGRKTRDNFAFIAMAMDGTSPELDDILDTIKAGASECGVLAERVDENETNERITDRILVAIEEAEYVIVDLSHERPNVYYEAGFAQGLGKIPIYTVREGTPVHFDLINYPVLRYKNMRSLREAISTRIARLTKIKEQSA